MKQFFSKLRYILRNCIHWWGFLFVNLASPIAWIIVLGLRDGRDIDWTGIFVATMVLWSICFCVLIKIIVDAWLTTHLKSY